MTDVFTDAVDETKKAHDYALRELRGWATDSQARWLHTHPTRWYDALTLLYADINEQLSVRNDEAQLKKIQALRLGEMDRTDYDRYLVEHLDWKQRAMRFKSHVQNRMRRVKSYSRISTEQLLIEHLRRAIRDAVEELDGGETERARHLLADALHTSREQLLEDATR